MTTEQQHVKPFADFLVGYNDGDTHEELSQSLVDLIAAVQASGKVGTLTYKVKVSPAGRNNGSQVMITDDLTVKAPVAGRAETIWFVDADGNPTRHNPDQIRMPLREVKGGMIVDPDYTGETGEVANR